MESKTMGGKPAVKVDGAKADPKGSKAEIVVKDKAEVAKVEVEPEPVTEPKEVKPVVSTTPKAAVEVQTPTPKPEAKKPATLDSLQEELHLLKRLVLEHNRQIIELQE